LANTRQSQSLATDPLDPQPLAVDAAGRKRVHDADEIMAEIVAERPVERPDVAVMKDAVDRRRSRARMQRRWLAAIGRAALTLDEIE